MVFRRSRSRQHSVTIDRVFAIADALGIPAHLLFTEDPAELRAK
jgi:hypothetical protein